MPTWLFQAGSPQCFWNLWCSLSTFLAQVDTVAEIPAGIQKWVKKVCIVSGIWNVIYSYSEVIIYSRRFTKVPSSVVFHWVIALCLSFPSPILIVGRIKWVDTCSVLGTLPGPGRMLPEHFDGFLNALTWSILKWTPVFLILKHFSIYVTRVWYL